MFLQNHISIQTEFMQNHTLLTEEIMRKFIMFLVILDMQNLMIDIQDITT